jgi:hypothetical protein
MARICKHDNYYDWCHICGKRSDMTADIWYPKKAESATNEQHLARRGKDICYIRICMKCAKRIVQVCENNNDHAL